MFPGMAFDQITVPVNKGDLLLCISDGVSETVDANGDMWDEREVDQVVLETAGASAGEVMERIVQKIRRYSVGAEQFDDMTVAAVRIVTGEGR
jgi:serine phosphatase RsbU (regulator of sigma subunit)